ncbi:MAG TPA: ABC transporter permease subunit, partial [Candidatus Atribacteria bacterium]|nr:ABC transporter permease subunit [Candidatus Atribacteria bacterium]
MSFALFKATLKKNWLLLFIFFGVLFMYAAVIISMFNPDDIAQLISMLDAVPEDMLKAFGLTTAITNMTTYLASWLYGLLMTSLPMVYSIILANRLVAKAVDNGSMAYLLSTPNSRAKIIITQGLYALLSLAILSA